MSGTEPIQGGDSPAMENPYPSSKRRRTFEQIRWSVYLLLAMVIMFLCGVANGWAWRNLLVRYWESVR